MNFPSMPFPFLSTRIVMGANYYLAWLGSNQPEPDQCYEKIRVWINRFKPMTTRSDIRTSRYRPKASGFKPRTRRFKPTSLTCSYIVMIEMDDLLKEITESTVPTDLYGLGLGLALVIYVGSQLISS